MASRQRTDTLTSAVTWAIEESAFHQLRVASAAGVTGLAGAEPEARRASGPDRAGGAVAVIPVKGVIRQTPTFLEMLFGIGGGTIGRIRTMLREARSDDSVSAIVLDVDSPGGTVFGVPELAEEVRAARSDKPVVAVANAYAGSAAYWLAAQATEMHVTPSGQVGSIGVFVAHEDWSRFDEDLGIKTTFIHAGEHKVEGNRYEPLSDAAEAHAQRMVDGYHDMFVDAVAQGRDTPSDTVRSDFGRGRMLMPSDALSAGMVDGISTLEDGIRRAADLAASPRRGASAASDPARRLAVASAGGTDLLTTEERHAELGMDPHTSTSPGDPWEGLDPDAVAASRSLRAALRAARV